MQKLDKFVKKYMILLVLAFLTLGFLNGLFVNPKIVKGLKKLILPSAFFMLWLMMISMDIKKFANAIKYPKELIVSIVMSLIVAPLVMWPIAMIVTKNPKMFSGLMLAGIVPPGGFVTYWSGILSADIGLAVVIELSAFIVSLVWIPYGMKLFVGKKVPINVGKLFIDILILLVGPFLLAYITRMIILKKGDQKGLKKVTPTLHFTSSLMAFYLVFAGISLKARFIYKHPGLIIFPALGMFFYYLLMFPFSYFIGHRVFKMKYDKAIPVVYGSSTKNLSIAMGLAIAAFGPLALMGVVSALLFQMPMASIWYKVFDKIRIKQETLGKAIEEEAEEIVEDEKEEIGKVEEEIKEEVEKLEEPFKKKE